MTPSCKNRLNWQEVIITWVINCLTIEDDMNCCSIGGCAMYDSMNLSLSLAVKLFFFFFHAESDTSMASWKHFVLFFSTADCVKKLYLSFNGNALIILIRRFCSSPMHSIVYSFLCFFSCRNCQLGLAQNFSVSGLYKTGSFSMLPFEITNKIKTKKNSLHWLCVALLPLEIRRANIDADGVDCLICYHVTQNSL